MNRESVNKLHYSSKLLVSPIQPSEGSCTMIRPDQTHFRSKKKKKKIAGSTC